MTHSSATDKKRTRVKYVWLLGIIFAFVFSFIIWALGPYLNHFTERLILRNDLNWYYWKLPERDFLGMTICWILYLAHQISIWTCIYFGQKNKFGFISSRVKGLSKYTFTLYSSQFSLL